MNRSGADPVDELISPGLRIARNAGYLFVSDIGVRLVSSLVSILVARYLGPEQFGMLAVALAFAGVAGYFTDLGVTQVMIREGTRPGVNIPHLLSGSLRLRVVLAAGTMVVSGIVALFYYPSPTLRVVILVVAVPAIWAGAFRGVGTAYFTMTQDMKYAALINSVAAVVAAGTLFSAVMLRWPLTVLAIAYGLSATVAGALGMILVLRRTAISGGWYRDLFAGLPAFTIGGFLTMLIPQLGPLLLPRAAGLEETGYFAAAYRVPGALYAVPGVVGSAFSPQLFHYGTRERDLHLRLSQRQIRVMGFLGLLMAIPFSFHSHWVVRMVFGPEWVETGGPALAFLAWVVALQSVSDPLGDALTTQGLQARRTVVQGVAVVVGAGLVWWLGGKWGAMGAAMAALATGFTMVVGFLVGNPKAKALAWHLVRSVGVKAALGLPVAWGLRLAVGTGWLAFALTAGVVAGIGWILDKEIRQYAAVAYRSLFQRGGAWRGTWG